MELHATRAFKRVLYIKLVIGLVLRNFNGSTEQLLFLILLDIMFSCYKDIQYSRIKITLALRIVHLQTDQKLGAQ